MFTLFKSRVFLIGLTAIVAAFIGCADSNIENPVSETPVEVSPEIASLPADDFAGHSLQEFQLDAVHHQTLPQILSGQFWEAELKLKAPPAGTWEYTCDGYAKAKGIPKPCNSGWRELWQNDYVFHFDTFMSFDPNKLRIYSDDPAFVTYIAKNVPQGLPVAFDPQGGTPQIRVCTGKKVWKEFGLTNIEDNLYVWISK